MIPSSNTTTQPLQEYIRICEKFLSDDITDEKLGAHEVAIVKMYIDLLAVKFS